MPSMQSFPFLMFDELGVRLGVKLRYCGVQLKFRPLLQTQELDPLGWEQLPPNSCTSSWDQWNHSPSIGKS